MAGLLSPLAEAGISVFAVSTFDTDYVLTKEDHWSLALDVLRRQGYGIHSTTLGIAAERWHPWGVAQKCFEALFELPELSSVQRGKDCRNCRACGR
jgi:hypothetical protein